MIVGFEVGSIFRIIDEASPALKAILTQVRALNAQLEKARGSLAALGKLPMPTGLTTAVGETIALATAWGDVAKNAGAARIAIGSASAAASRTALPAPAAAAAAAIGGGGAHNRAASHKSWLSGPHVYGPSVGMPGGPHVSAGRMGGGAASAVVGLGAIGYMATQAAKYEDAAVFMAQHAGVDYQENRAKFRKMLEDATIGTGYSEHDVSLAAQQELRMFGDTGGSQGVDVLPKMLRYAATEARLKGTSLEQSMSSLTGLAHMLQKYGEKDVDEIVPAFSALSVRSPMTLAQQERAFGYAVPLLHSAMGLDPMQVMASSVALARAGITNTKAGTWIREMMIGAMPGTSMMSKMRFNKHEGALKELGLVDDKHKPTWFDDKGQPDELKFLKTVAENLPKIDITRRAAVLTALAGKQGAGALAVLAEPAVQPQITAMYNEMKNPENMNRMRNFMTVYNEQSTLQSARTAMQTFNVLMADLGDKILPSVNQALGNFKSIIEGIRGLIPGGEGKGGAVVGGHAIVGAAGGALAGGLIGLAGGPVGALGGAAVGGVLGAAEGFMEGYSKAQGEKQDKKTTDEFAEALKRGGETGAAPTKIEATTAPLTLNLNIDGRTLAETIGTMLTKFGEFPTQAPAADGMGQHYSGDHNFPDN